jgi:hypothetical protein
MNWLPRQTVVVPVDFSEDSFAAFQTAQTRCKARMHARATGPMVHPWNDWPVGPKQPTVGGSCSQGDALGWVNAGPSAQIGNKTGHHPARSFLLHTLTF